MGFVAQYQQFDPDATDPGSGGLPPADAYAVTHAGAGADAVRPAPRVGSGYSEPPAHSGWYEPGLSEPEPAAGEWAERSESFIDLSAPRPEPVEHRRPSRLRAGVLVVAALSVIVAGGVGYTLVHDSRADHPSAAGGSRATEAPGTPSGAPGDVPVPRGDPLHTSPAPAPDATAGPAGAPSSAAVTAATTAPDVMTTWPAGVPFQPAAPLTAPAAAPSRTAVPRTPRPSSAPTSAPPAPVRRLTAAYSYRTDDGDGAITGYVGTVRVVNPGDTAVTFWTVQLTVPSGATASIESGEVTASLDDTQLTFQPASGAVAAHGSVSFSFSLAGDLDALPSDCTIDGAFCS
jgi:hypothetical protein